MHLLVHSCCWAAPFYASADVVVFSASILDGKLSSFFGKGLLGLEKVRLTNPRASFHVCAERMHWHCSASLPCERSFFAHR